MREKVLRIHKMINKENALMFYRILSIKFLLWILGVKGYNHVVTVPCGQLRIVLKCYNLVGHNIYS